MRLSLGAILLSGTLFSSVAMAADMPASDNYIPPSAAPIVTPFQGFYLGGFLGYGGTRFEGIVDSSELPDSEFSEIFSGNFSSGIVYGGFLGYNMVNGNTLFGLELDFGGASNSETAFEEAAPDRDWATHSINWTSSLRARIGAMVGAATALYVTGGAALVSSNFHAFDNQDDVDANDGQINLLSVGAIVGGGIETMVTQTMSVRLEGLYTFPMQAHVFQEEQLTDDMDEGDFAQIGGRFEIRAGAAIHF
jgi:opacity protein-like surface antigen